MAKPETPPTSLRVQKEIAKETALKNKRAGWAVVRIPRELWHRLRDGKGKMTLHEAITHALDAREDPKAARRVSELRALVANLTARVLELERELGKGRGGPLSAAARTVPMFTEREIIDGAKTIPAANPFFRGPTNGTGILRVKR